VTLSAARRLARFVVGPGPKDAPGRVVQRAGLLALDTLGCSLAAARYDFSRATLLHRTAPATS
jgi:2-methylcitrate dehydratase PrpD